MQAQITDPDLLKQIKKAKKREKKRLKALQLSMNGDGDESMLTSDGSMLNNSSFNSTMNTSEVAEDCLDNSIKKKKKKKKKQNAVSI